MKSLILQTHISVILYMSYFTELHGLQTGIELQSKLRFAKWYPNYAIKSGVEGMFFDYLSSLVLHVCKGGQILAMMDVASNISCSVMPRLPNMDRAGPVPEARTAGSLKQ